MMILGGKFPGVVLAIGADVPWDNYNLIAQQVADYGYVVIVPQPRVYDIAFPGFSFNFTVVSPAVIVQAKNELLRLNSLSSSPLYNLVDANNFAILGHSLGGTNAMIVASSNASEICSDFNQLASLYCFGYGSNIPIPDSEVFGPSLKAVVGYGSSLVSRVTFAPGIPVTTVPVNTSGLPVAIVHGSLDGRSLYPDLITSYDTLGTPKALINLTGANHYGMNDNNTYVSVPDPNPQVRSQEWSVSMSAKIIDTFFSVC